MAEYYSIMCTYHGLSICSSINEHLAYFHPWLMWILWPWACIYMYLFEYPFLILFGTYLGMKSLDHTVILYLTFPGSAVILFVAHPFSCHQPPMRLFFLTIGIGRATSILQLVFVSITLHTLKQFERPQKSFIVWVKSINSHCVRNYNWEFFKAMKPLLSNINNILLGKITVFSKVKH